MTEDGSGLHVRQAPRRRSEEIKITDLTMLVRVPGHPDALRVFTDAERAEADAYATGGTVVALPPSPVDTPAASDPLRTEGDDVDR